MLLWRLIGELTCDENTISNLPEDLEGCDFDYPNIWAAEIRFQPITILKNNAFQAFTGLSQLSLSFNNINLVEQDAFRGLNQVEALMLRKNNLSNIEEGALDHLVKLQFLDLRGNDFLEEYTTNAWYFCNNMEKHDLFANGPALFKNLQASELNEVYCNANVADNIGICSSYENQLDCTAADSLKDAPCQIFDQSFDNILFNFPVDPNPSEVADFGEGESNKFFKEFNSQDGSMEHTKFVKEIKLYETKFDLSSLNTLTSNRTEKVVIRADTVHITSPMTINHHLEIHARVVSINHPITMNMTKSQFIETKDLESWASKEEVYTVSNVVMHRKSYGFITIIQNTGNILAPTESVCRPKIVSVEESGTNIEDWYDITSVNLNYVCARTVMNTRSNSNARLVDDMSNFMLGFVYNDTIINNRGTFLAVQKFKKLKEMNSINNVHNIPSYTIGTISQLAEVMHQSIGDYKANEIAQELNMTLASGRAQDMQLQFKIIEEQQQQYFEKEQAQMDAIWAADDNNWDFDFEHRNGIEDQISGSLDDISREMLDMQEQDLTNTLAAAVLSQKEIQTSIEEYEKQVSRWLDTVQASMNVQATLLDRLKNDSAQMEIEFDNFDRAIEEYKEMQEAKAARSLFFAAFSFGVGLAAGKFDGPGIFDELHAIEDILKLLEDLISVIESMNAIKDMIDEIDFSGIADIHLNLNTNFKDALQTAVELKLKGSDFDELAATAEIKLDALMTATDNKIKGTDDVMMSCKRVADVGHGLITEASLFAENVLALAERNDMLEAARQNMIDTTEEVERIKQLLVELEQKREDFENDRNNAKAEYEQWLEDLRANYENITEEIRAEYKEKATESFEKFKVVFKGLSDSYNDKIYDLMASIHRKFYGLKEHSMVQRSMIMTLYLDFCDANFYHTFETCDTQKMPSMSADLDTMLKSLIDIQWDSITSDSRLPGTPTEFDSIFRVKEKHVYLNGTKNYIINNLRDKFETEINLKDLDTTNDFDSNWRIRIEQVYLVLYDEDGYPLQSNSDEVGRNIQINIKYPTVFNDTDSRHESHTFLALDFDCYSNYATEGEGIVILIFIKIKETFI